MPRINEILDAEAAGWWANRHDPQVMERLVQHYRKFAEKIAQPLFRKIGHRALTWDDVASAAMFGLCQAIRRYQPGSHAAFTSFATWRVRGAVLDAARENDWVPHSARAAGKNGKLDIPLMTGLWENDKEVLEMPDQTRWHLNFTGIPEQYHRAVSNVIDKGLYVAAQLEGVSTGMLSAVLRGKLKAVLIDDC